MVQERDYLRLRARIDQLSVEELKGFLPGLDEPNVATRKKFSISFCVIVQSF